MKQNQTAGESVDERRPPHRADFSRAWNTLTTSVSGSGWVNPAGPVNVNVGDSILLTATPDQNCRFSGWSVSEGNAVISNPASLSTRVKLFSASVKVTATFVGTAVYGSTSRLISVTGHLTDNGGRPIGNDSAQTVDAVVRLCTSLAGGDTVYQETFRASEQKGISVDKGAFIAQMGKGNSLVDVQAVLRNHANLYSEIGILTVNGEQTLRPRLALSAAAYTIVTPEAQPRRGMGDPNTANLMLPFGTFYINELDNSTWMKTQIGWAKIGL